MAADHGVWDAAAWYRALPLTERLPPPGSDDLPGRDFLVDGALGRLRSWKAQRPFVKEELFAQRLALDSISEDDLLHLVAEPARSLQDRTADAPDWLTVLRHAFTEAPRDQEFRRLLEGVQLDHPLAGCLPALAPLLQHGLDAVRAGMDDLGRRRASLPFEAELLPRAFLENLVPTVLFQMSKPLILDMNIARLRGSLHGETSHTRFRSFIRQLDREGSIESFLLRYPVLARELVITVGQWADFLCEFLTRLSADWAPIRTTFSTDQDPGLLVEVDAGKGDRHRRGRSVLLLRFSSGMRLLYKPKPLAVDVHFQQLLEWLNDRGAEPPLRPLVLLDRGEYGWSEYVTAFSCTSAEEVSRFYQRQGGYLALLYALEATDLHNENLIAAGEHPVLVDLEALFHPRVHDSDPILANNLAAAALDRSVWQVGILPRRVWSDDDSVGVDMSGLGGQAGQLNPHRVVGWNAAGTDAMRLDRRRVELPVSENRPRLGDQDVDVLSYRSAVVTGFTRMYRLLCHHREALLAEQLPRFADDDIRVVVRSTNVYTLLWYESFHPDVLRDALDRDRLFDRLWGEVVQRPHLARVIAAERRDLWHGDVPFFSTSPASRAIRTSDGEAVADFLRTPSLELVRQRVEQLGDDDLATQTWVVEASLATLLMDREDGFARPVQVPSPRRLVDRDRLLALAGDLGRRLDQLALQNSAGAHWLGVGPLDEYTWGVHPSGIDLYAGTSGITLFLAYLGAVTGEPSPTVLARRAVTSLRAQLEAWLETGNEDWGGSPPTVGPYDGLGSIVFLLTHLGVLWAEPQLLREAEKVVDQLPALVAQDTHLDVIYGSAGCLLAVLGLHAVRPSPRTLRVAVGCGDRLLATVRSQPQGAAWITLDDQPPLGGFSHGTAGIAFSLLRLAAVSGEDRFRQCALRALAYDRSLFVPGLDNWTDLRVFPSRRPGAEQGDASVAEPNANSMVAWCHGAPGIGLARLGTLDQVDDDRTRNEIDSALRATIRYGFDINHCLCHGALGNVELLVTAARVLDRPTDHGALRRAMVQIVTSIEANGPVTGVPLGVETPGFMTGLAGIGYQLLRLADPDKVPSALLLAPPGRPAQG
ncbi:MAG: type 2 lanthipeptide synthetase LanM family protein [Blastococcus sp.]